MTDLMQVQNAITEHGKKVEEKFNSYEQQLKEAGIVSESVKSDLAAMAKDFEGMKKDMQSAQDEMTALSQKNQKLESNAAPKSIGEQFVSSDSFKAYKDGTNARARMDFQNNTIIGESGGEPSENLVGKDRMSGIVGGAFRQFNILDLIPRGTTSSNQVQYARELVYTNAAAETSEGAQKPETTLTFEDVNVPVRTIAHTIKVSKQVMDDAPALASYLNSRMSYGVRFRAESQIVNGDGLSPNLSGLFDAGNFTAITADPGKDLAHYASKIKYGVIGSDYAVDVFLVNPVDWGTYERAISDNSSSGDAVSYLQNGLVPTLWGIPVVASNAVPAGQMMGVNLASTMFWERQGVTVEMFDQNEDDVEKNLLTVRAEMRGAFTVFRPAALAGGTILVP